MASRTSTSNSSYKSHVEGLNFNSDYVLLSHNAAISTADGVGQFIPLNTFIAGNPLMHDTGNNRVTIVSDGLYHIEARVAFAATNTTGYRWCRVYRNNNFGQSQTFPGSQEAGSNQQDNCCPLSFTTRLVAGDFLTIYAWQNSGGPIDCNANLGVGLTVMRVR